MNYLVSNFQELKTRKSKQTERGRNVIALFLSDLGYHLVDLSSSLQTWNLCPRYTGLAVVDLQTTESSLLCDAVKPFKIIKPYFHMFLLFLFP